MEIYTTLYKRLMEGINDGIAHALTKRPDIPAEDVLDIHVPEDSSSHAKHTRDWYRLMEMLPSLDPKRAVDVNRQDMQYICDLFDRYDRLPEECVDLINDVLTLDEISQLRLNCLIYKIQGGDEWNDDDRKFNREMVMNINSKENPLYGCYDAYGHGDMIIRFITQRAMKDEYMGCNANLNWIDTSRVKNMMGLFKNMTTFCGNVSLWDVRNVENMAEMFMGCTMFRGYEYVIKSLRDRGMVSGIGRISVPEEMRCCAPISGWDVRNVGTMREMFRRSGFDGDIRDWQIHPDCGTYCMFHEGQMTVGNLPVCLKERGDKETLYGVRGLNEAFRPVFEKKSVQRIPEMDTYINFLLGRSKVDPDWKFVEERVQGISSKENPLYGYFRPSGYVQVKSIVEKCGRHANLNWIDMSGIKMLRGLFCHSKFNGDISLWDVRNVEDMTMTFMDSAFNGDISAWDVRKVKDMTATFKDNKVFNGNISGWKPVKVVTMRQMFENSVFDGVICEWRTPLLEDMTGMFRDSMFSGNLAGWRTGNVRNFTETFKNSKFNGRMDGWSFRSAEDMTGMFSYAQFFNQDISKWRLPEDVKMDSFLFQAKAFDTDISKMKLPFRYAKSFNIFSGTKLTERTLPKSAGDEQRRSREKAERERAEIERKTADWKKRFE